MHPSCGTHPKMRVQSKRVQHADLATGNLQCYGSPRGGWGCWLEGPVIDRPLGGWGCWWERPVIDRPILWRQAGLFRSLNNLPCGFFP